MLAAALVLLLLASAAAQPAAIEARKVRVEGELVEADIHPGGNLIRYAPILNQLRVKHAYDPAMRTVRVHRPYDNAGIELVPPDGLVRANGQVIGRMPNAELEEPQEGWLSPNAISILSGAVPRLVGNEWIFELDPRLRPDNNLELWISGKRVATPVAPRASGTTLLVPLRPIADALGARIVVEGQTVSVTRLQDGLVISWNAQTGLIVGNKRSIGIVAPSALTELGALLLPKDAVAALTGTNIILVPGTNRIEANLDDRLAGVTTPSAKVIERARKTPLEVQQTRFQVTTTGFNTLDMRAHWSIYNGQLHMEAPADGRLMGDLDRNPQRVSNPFRPTWLSLAWQSLEGNSGLFGDTVAARRELDGVGITRLRGVGAQFASPDGQLRAVLGSPLAAGTGSGTATSNVSYPAFAGTAAGLRWYSMDGNAEVGVSARADDTSAGGSQVVMSWNQTSRWGDLKRAAEGRGSAWTLYSDLHTGVVNRPQESAGGAGGRGYLALSAQLPHFWNAGSSVQWNSATFNGEPAQAANGLWLRPPDQGSVDLSLSGPVAEWLSVGARGFGRRTGVADPMQSSSVGGGANVGLSIAPLAATVVADYSTVSARAPVQSAALNARPPSTADVVAVPLERTEADRMTLTLDKRFSLGSLGARYERTESRGALRQRARALTSTFGANPLVWQGARGETLSLTGAVVGTWSRLDTDTGESRNQGASWSANLNMQSGNRLGERWRVTANVGVSGTRNTVGNITRPSATTLDNLLNGTTPAVTTTQSSNATGWYFSARSQHALSRHFTMEWGANKAQGQSTFAYLLLTGVFAGAPPRANLLPRARHGLLQGRVFLDANGNGIEDPGERGMAGVVVRLGSTPWALRTDNNGNFTINNVPQGPYAVVVEGSSLPLGYRMAANTAPRISILDQELTEVSLAIIETGQLRGRVYVDTNGNGMADGDETGPVGKLVTLIDAAGKSIETQTTVFGQFVFDSLMVGRYTLVVDDVRLPVEITRSERFIVRDVAVK